MNHADCLEILYFPQVVLSITLTIAKQIGVFLSLGLLVMPGSFLLLSGLIK